MKKNFFILALIVSVLCLTGCGKEKEKEKKTENTQTIEEDINYERYDTVIQEYFDALDEYDIDDVYSDNLIMEKYSFVNPSIISHISRFGSEGLVLTYGYYDIDKNGVDELIVGVSDSYGAIYSYDVANGKPTVIYFQDTIERGILEIFDNGVILSSGSGGAALHIYVFGKIASDGISYELLENVTEEYLFDDASGNQRIEYRDTLTDEVLSYNSYDEIVDKYIKGASPINSIL